VFSSYYDSVAVYKLKSLLRERERDEGRIAELNAEKLVYNIFVNMQVECRIY